MGINEITMGMTPQEKEIYFAHLEKRCREEAERVEAERARIRAYRDMLVEDAIKRNPHIDPEKIKKMSIRALEYIV